MIAQGDASLVSLQDFKIIVSNVDTDTVNGASKMLFELLPTQVLPEPSPLAYHDGESLLSDNVDVEQQNILFNIDNAMVVAEEIVTISEESECTLDSMVAVDTLQVALTAHKVGDYLAYNSLHLLKFS